MKRKYIALAAALIMLLCVLCACGKDEDTKTPEETGTPPAVSTDNPDVQPTPAVEQSSVELGETADAGDGYISKMVFIGDSTTYGL